MVQDEAEVGLYLEWGCGEAVGDVKQERKQFDLHFN